MSETYLQHKRNLVKILTDFNDLNPGVLPDTSNLVYGDIPNDNTPLMLRDEHNELVLKMIQTSAQICGDIENENIVRLMLYSESRLKLTVEERYKKIEETYVENPVASFYLSRSIQLTVCGGFSEEIDRLELIIANTDREHSDTTILRAQSLCDSLKTLVSNVTKVISKLSTEIKASINEGVLPC